MVKGSGTYGAVPPVEKRLVALGRDAGPLMDSNIGFNPTLVLLN